MTRNNPVDMGFPKFLKIVIVVFCISFVIPSEVKANNVLVKPTKLWKFLGNNDEDLQQRLRENIEEYSVERIKCLRYCIENKAPKDEMPKILHLIWNLDMKHKTENVSVLKSDNDFQPEIMRGASIKSDISQNSSNKCTFSIIIGCEITKEIEANMSHTEKKFINSLKPNLGSFGNINDNNSPTLNFVKEKLIDKSNLTDETDINFGVKRNQGEVSVIVLGNVSQIDLKMPIELSTSEKAPRLTLALARMPDGNSGLRLNVLNSPPGGWRVGFKSYSDEKYRVIVTQTIVPEFVGKESRNGKALPISEYNRMQIKRKDTGIDQFEDDGDLMYAPSESQVDNQFSTKMTSEKLLQREQDYRTSFTFPLDENIEDFNNTIFTRISSDHIEDRTIGRELELGDLRNSFFEELPIRKPLIVELNPQSEMIVTPGRIHRVIFDVTNNNKFQIMHYFAAKVSQFRVVNNLPRSQVIAAENTINVPIDIFIPPITTDSLTLTVSLHVQGIEYVEKIANLYVRALRSRIIDDIRPTIYYYFNNNCAFRTSAEKCMKNYWSVDIVVQDADSGLKSVVSSRRSVYPRNQYISGTSSPVNFYYASNCCNRIVEVTATDMTGNIISRRIDVGEWNNLTEGEIAAVVMGVFFIILLIFAIIITILYCSNKRSLELPYSQRYGSRSQPTRADS